MAKRGAKIYRVNINGNLKEMTPAQFSFLEKKEKYRSRNIKRTFFIFLDALILIAFSLSVYFTLGMDYTKTILFMVIGILLLSFFIIRGILRRK